MSDIFEQLREDYEAGGMSSALATAETTLREQQRYHELFEVLKMKTRQELSLPLLHEND